jgi:hypothetical protein
MSVLIVAFLSLMIFAGAPELAERLLGARMALVAALAFGLIALLAMDGVSWQTAFAAGTDAAFVATALAIRRQFPAARLRGARVGRWLAALSAWLLAAGLCAGTALAVLLHAGAGGTAELGFGAAMFTLAGAMLLYRPTGRVVLAT